VKKINIKLLEENNKINLRETKEEVQELSEIKEIKELLNQGNMSILVGAGFSKNANLKYPAWLELLSEMVIEMYSSEYKAYLHKCHETNSKIKPLDFVWEKSSKIGYLEIVEKYIKDKGMREAITFYIEDQFEKVVKSEHDLSLHKKLLELKWNNVYTTNYDTLLEDTNLQHDLDYQEVIEASKLSLGKNKKIIKLHGTLRTQKEIDENKFGFDGDLNRQYIIAKSDYDDYPKKHEAFTQLMKIALLQESFCLVGFSGEDPNFIRWVEWVREVLKKEDKKVYLIDASGNNITREKKLFFENYGIKNVSLKEIYKNEKDEKGRINSFLDTLAERNEKEKKEIKAQTQNVLRYEMLWDSLKFKGDLKEIEELEKYFSIPNKFVLRYSKNALLDNKHLILRDIRLQDYNKILYSLNFLNLCIRNSFIPLNAVFEVEELEEIETIFFNFRDTINSKTEIKIWNETIILFLKNSRFIENLEKFEFWKSNAIELDKNENLKNKILYQKALLLLLKFNFEEAKRLIDSWEILETEENIWSFINKAFILILLDQNNFEIAFNLIKQAEKLVKNSQDKLFILEIKHYFEISKTHIDIEETENEINKYKSMGLYGLDSLRNYFELPQKNKKKPKRNQSIKNITGGNIENNIYYKQLFMIEFMFYLGVPLKIGYMSWIPEKEWKDIFKYIFEEKLNLSFILSLFYGDNKKEELIVDISKYIKQSDKIIHEDKVQLLKNIIRNFDLNSKKIQYKYMYAISELVSIVPEKNWISFFEELEKKRKDNLTLNNLILSDNWGLGKPFSKMLPFVSNKDLVKEIIKETFKLIKGTRSQKNLSVEFLYYILEGKDKRAFKFTEIDALIEENLLGSEINDVYIVILFYLKELLEKETITKIQKYFLGKELKNIRHLNLILEICNHSEEIKEKIKFTFLENIELFLSSGINGKTRSFGIFDGVGLNLIEKNKINFTTKELKLIYEHLEKEFRKIKTWYENRKEFRNFGNDPYFLEVFKKYIITYKESFDFETKEVLEEIERLFFKLLEIDNLVQGLLSDDSEKYLNSLQLLYKNIKNDINKLFELELTIVLVNIMSKKEVRLEESLDYIVGILYLFEDDIKWIGKLENYFIKILINYKGWNNLDQDMEYIERILILLSSKMVKVYKNHDEIVEYWLKKKDTSIYEKNKRIIL